MRNEAETLSINHNWATGASVVRVVRFLLDELQQVRAAIRSCHPAAAGRSDARPGSVDAFLAGGGLGAAAAGGDSAADSLPFDLEWEEQCQRLLAANARFSLSQARACAVRPSRVDC